MKSPATLVLAMAFIILPLPLGQLGSGGAPPARAGADAPDPSPDNSIPWFYDDMRPPDNPPPGFVMPSIHSHGPGDHLDAGSLPDYSTLTVTDAQLESPAGARTTYPLLHNVSLSLSFEWDASVAEFQDMEGGLRRFSNLVYDYTDGQFTIGRFEVYNNQNHWSSVNIHVLNKSWYRANAQYGGIYYGGIIQIGRDAWGQQWNTGMGAVTLAHEFGHYGLFLPDEYVEATQVSLCNNNAAGTCIMSDPYSFYEICTDESHNAQSTGNPNSCWNYIKYYYSDMVEVHGNPDPGPSVGPPSTVNFHYPDLSVSSTELGISSLKANEGENTTIVMPVHNIERLVQGAVTVRFYLDTVSPGSIIKTLNLNIGGQDTAQASMVWQAAGGSHTIIVIVDPDNQVRELNEGNNQASKQVTVNNRPRISSNLVGFVSQEDVPLTVKMTSYASDAEDPASALRWSVVMLDNRQLASVTGQNGANQTLTFIPVLHWWGTTSVTIGVTDTGNLLAAREMNITFTFVNYQPLARDLSVSPASVLRGRTVEVSSSASDVEDREELLDAVFEWRPNGSADWKPLAGSYDGARFKAMLAASIDSKTGKADIRVAFIDTLDARGPWAYLNASLELQNNPPHLMEIGVSEPAVTRGGLVTLFINASDPETAKSDLLPTVEYSVADGGWQPLGVQGEFFENSWRYSLDLNASWPVGAYDLRARVRDSDGGESQWQELSSALVVSNSLPVIDSARAVRTKLLRNETTAIVVTGGDYETAAPQLTMEIKVQDPRGRDQSGYVSRPRWVNGSFEARFQPPPSAILGKYTVSVRLGDADGGWTEWRDLAPLVVVGNNLPLAAFICPDTAVQGDPVRFDATNSSDLENHLDMMSFSWNFGDGSSPGLSKLASHTFNRPGSFRVVLTLTDKDGAVSTAERTVSVRERPAEAGLSSGGIGIIMTLMIAIVAAAAGGGAYLVVRKRKAATSVRPGPAATSPSSRTPPSQRIEAVPVKADRYTPQADAAPGAYHDSMVQCRQEHALQRRAAANAEALSKETTDDSKSSSGSEPTQIQARDMQMQRPPPPES